jgi:hypothetical protein
MKTMTRREFLRAGVGVAATVSTLEMVDGCATTETPKVKTLVFPSLPYNKIQPPREGCLVGFFKEPEAYARLKDSRFIPQHSAEIEAARSVKNVDEFVEMLKTKSSVMTGGYQIGNEITYVEKALSAKPFIFVVMGPKLYTEFPATQSTEVAKRRIVPFVRASLSSIDLPIQIPGFADALGSNLYS